MTAMLQFDFRALPVSERYKLLTGLVVPRPIALVTTLSKEGVVNAAPFSFFNVFAEDPGLVVLGINGRSDGSVKDTVRYAREGGFFVVNMVDEDLAEAMNDCAVDFPPGTSEPAALGLALVPGIHVPVPHLAVGPERDLVIGEIVGIAVREGVVDPGTMRIDFDAYRPVGRLVGSLYARQGDRFSMVRESFDQWSKRTGNGSRP